MFLPEAISEIKEKCDKTAVLCDKLRKSFHAKHHGIEKYAVDAIGMLTKRLEEQDREVYKLKQEIYSLKHNIRPEEHPSYLERVI